MDPYALIAQYPNAGDAFSTAFDKGMQRNALSAFAQNPNAQTAGPAARYDPGTVLKYNLENQKEKAELGKQQRDEWHKYAGQLAKWADTPEKRDQAVDYLLSHNHPDISTQDLLALKSLPPDQWQAVRANFMALGGVQDQNPVQDPSIIREFDIASQRGLIPQGTTYEQYVQMRNPSAQQPIVLPQSYTQVSGAPAANLPTVASPQDAMKLAPGTQFRLPDGRIGTVPGGAGGNASGGFPQ